MRVCIWLVAMAGLLVVVMGVPIAGRPGYEPSSLVQEWGLAEVLGPRLQVNQHSSLKHQQGRIV